MGDCFITRRGGGGGGSTTKIITVESSLLLPEKADAGTIALVTAIEPNNVFIQRVQPETAALGDVWFVEGKTAYVVHVLKGNPVACYDVKQYNGSEWASVLACQYVNGAWATGLYLISGDSQCINVTGGWATALLKEQWVATATWADNTATFAYDSTAIWAWTQFYTANKISLDEYSTLRVKGPACYFALGAGGDQGHILFNIFDDLSASLNHIAQHVMSTEGEFDVSLDISGVTGEHYVGVLLHSGGYRAPYITVSSMWLE